MKYLIITTIALCIENIVFSQADTASMKPDSSKSLNDLDMITCGITYYPQYPGGDIAISKFFAKNMRYPKAAQEKGMSGKAIVQFAVDTFGNTTEISIVKSTSNYFNHEAKRVVSLLKGWKFSKDSKGKKRMEYRRQPFTFRIPERVVKRTKQNYKKKSASANKTNAT